MKVAIISGSRADAGALVAVQEALNRAGVLTDWFSVPPPKWAHDTRLAIAMATALACTETGTFLDSSKPDLVFVHGDRYEILGATTAAYLLGLPIAHLGGGDITEGSQDDSLRHAITKLSHLHFATCEDSANRIVQLGEQENRVFNVGDPGIDTLINQPAPRFEDVTKGIGFSDKIKAYLLVALHPNTLGDTADEVENLITGLKTALVNDATLGAVLLDPNMDAGRSLIDQRFRQLAASSARFRYCEQLPRTFYLGLLRHAKVLIGNSSAAYYEAPALGTPVIAIGNRQKGRKQSSNFVAAVSTHTEFLQALASLTHHRVRAFDSPYGDGQAADRIAGIIKRLNPKDLLHKSFYNIIDGYALTQFAHRYSPNGNGAESQVKHWLDETKPHVMVH